MSKNILGRGRGAGNIIGRTYDWSLGPPDGIGRTPDIYS
jgi:hypothetical protein